jgi:hypothetical protein
MSRTLYLVIELQPCDFPDRDCVSHVTHLLSLSFPSGERPVLSPNFGSED